MNDLLLLLGILSPIAIPFIIEVARHAVKVDAK